MLCSSFCFASIAHPKYFRECLAHVRDGARGNFERGSRMDSIVHFKNETCAHRFRKSVGAVVELA